MILRYTGKVHHIFCIYIFLSYANAMPELPEVQTTASMLNKKIKGLQILDVWTDYDSPFNKGKNNIKDKNYFPFFKKEIINKKIYGI